MMCRRVVSKNVSTNCSVDELSCSHASVTVGSVFTFWKEAAVPEVRATVSLLGTHKPKQAALRLEVYTVSSARLNLHRGLSICVI